MSSNGVKSKITDSKAKDKTKNGPIVQNVVGTETMKAIDELINDTLHTSHDTNVSLKVYSLAVQMVRNILSGANMSREHKEAKQIDLEDVETSIQDFKNSFNALPKKEENSSLATSIAHINSKPLPPLRCEYGFHTPNDRFMQMQPDFSVNEDAYLDKMNAAYSAAIASSSYEPPVKMPRKTERPSESRKRPLESASSFKMTLPKLPMSSEVSVTQSVSIVTAINDVAHNVHINSEIQETSVMHALQGNTADYPDNFDD